MPLDGLQSFGGFQYAVIDIEDRQILCFDQHPAIIEGHHAACYMHAAAQADTFRLLQFHRLESLLPAEIKDAMIVRPLIKDRSEEHTSELQSLMRISYAVFCLKKNNI